MRFRLPAVVLVLALGTVATAMLVPELQADRAGPEQPFFSVPRGLCSAPFDVTLSSVTPGAAFRYTVDGSQPSATHGEIYAGPIRITTTTPLRAVSVIGENVSAVVTHSYIFLADVVRQPEDPQGYPDRFADDDGDGPYPADYAMDQEVVEDEAYAPRVQDALRSIPTISIVADVDQLFGEDEGIYFNSAEKGDEWEQVVSAEWITANGSEHWGLHAGLRAHGQGSRKPYRTPKHSMRLYFRADYGTPKLDFDIFERSNPVLANRGAVDEFDRVLLRNGGNRTWPYFSSGMRSDADYVNDEFGRIAFRELGHLSPHGGRYVHLYLNGLYWGLYNITERIDEKFLLSYLGGNEGEFDLIFPDEEAEPSYEPTAGLGSIDAWEQLHDLLRNDVDDAVYNEALLRVDVVNLADYILLTHYVGNTDWPIHNWYAYRRTTGDDLRFRMMAWDNDSSLRESDVDISDWTEPGTPAELFHRLMTHPAFRALFAERVALHTSGTAVLSPARCAARYRALTDIIDLAVIGESARWGDYSRDVYIMDSRREQALPAHLYTRDDFWVPQRQYMLEEYCPERTEELIDQYESHGWYEPGLKAPEFSSLGGAVAAGTDLVITHDNDDSEIVYAIDGVDPRAEDGTRRAGAVVAGDRAVVPLTRVTTVTARVHDGETWSPPSHATFFTPQDLSAVVIHEVHYAPVDTTTTPGKQLEFLELHNRGGVDVQLDHAWFNKGVQYTFPPGSTLAAGGFVVLASDAAAFQARHGFAPAGVYGGQLSNDGETLELRTAYGDLIDLVTYGTARLWPSGANERGGTLELKNPNLDNAIADSWQVSADVDGTPGRANSPPVGGSSSCASVSSSSAAVTLSSSAAMSSSLSAASSSSSAAASASSSAAMAASTTGDPPLEFATSSSAAAVSSSVSSVSTATAASSSVSTTTGAPLVIGQSSSSSASSSSGTTVTAACSSSASSTGTFRPTQGGHSPNDRGGGCGCEQASPPSWLMWLGAVLLLRRRGAR